MIKKTKPPTSFADTLKAERQRAGLTQTECANLLDVSLHTICKWEAGKDPLPLTQEGAIARLRGLKSSK